MLTQSNDLRYHEVQFQPLYDFQAGGLELQGWKDVAPVLAMQYSKLKQCPVCRGERLSSLFEKTARVEANRVEQTRDGYRGTS